ncbi:MAG TPA: ISL3 family transposase [Polyangiaceae bacterium]|nr:ISL3 family transposase [Polyangiaceae bacterium]
MYPGENPSLSALLAEPGLELESDRIQEGVLLLSLRTTRAHAPCPACGHDARRVHSRYQRTLSDLPWGGLAVRLLVRIRRFRCEHAGCERTVFAERLPALAPAYARRTRRAAEALTHVGAALGGEAGARLAPAVGLRASADTVLRLVDRAPVAEPPTPRVLGVEDWARRRGHTYGTILVDLERRVPVDLLPDRTADALAQWLRDRSGVAIVCRDRAEAYAEGARRGAPAAVQVADRWHWLKNAGEALERLLTRHRKALERAAAETGASPEGDGGDEEATPARGAPPTCPPEGPRAALPAAPTDALRAARRAHRVALYERVRALHADGVSLHAIGRQTGLSRPTVRKYLHADAFPERAPRRTKVGHLGAYDAHLRQRWSEGCRDAVVLWQELRARGFGGTARTVQRHVAAWRSQATAGGELAVRARAAVRPPSPRQARWWLMTPVEKRTPDRARFAACLLAQSDGLALGSALACEFARLVRERDVAALAPWFERAEASSLAEFRDFAAGLRRDEAAVEAALRYEWSNGQTEGQVNKLKLLKRQGYGRGSVALLRQRLLLAA